MDDRSIHKKLKQYCLCANKANCCQNEQLFNCLGFVKKTTRVLVLKNIQNYSLNHYIGLSHKNEGF